MTEEDRTMAATNFAQDFLASSSATSGPGAEAMVDSDPEPQESPDSCSPGPREEDQAFSPVWVKPGGRKDGDSGFISPDGASSQATTGMAVNPFYGANFNPQHPLEISHGAESDFKPLDSSLESENERYENGAPDGSENEEGDGGEYKKYNDFTENTDNFGKPSFTDFSRLESKLCEFEYARNESTDVKIENETPKSEKILTETLPGIETEQAIIEKFEENQTDVEKRELDNGNNDQWELDSNNLENKLDNCSDQMDVTTPEPITALPAEDYAYKATQEDGCNVSNPKEDSDSSSSDGEDEDHCEKMDQEKRYSSSSYEEEAQPYEKLPSYDGKDLMCADSSLDDVVYELRTESPNVELEMMNEKEFCPVPGSASTDAVEQDVEEPEIAGLTEESDVDVSINHQSLVNENFLESELEDDKDIELEKPTKEEFESNVDEEEQEEEDKIAVNSEALKLSEVQKQPEYFEQIETSLDSDVEETEEKSFELRSDSGCVGEQFPVVTMEPQESELLVSGEGAPTEKTILEQQEIPGVSGVMLEEEEEAGRQEEDVEDLLDLPQQGTKTGDDQETLIEDQFASKQESSVSVVDQTFDDETLIPLLPAQPEEQLTSEDVKLDEMIKINDEEVEDNDLAVEKEQQILSDGTEDDSDEEERAVDIADRETKDEDKEVIKDEDTVQEETNENSFIQKEDMDQMEIQPVQEVQENFVIQAKQEDADQFSAVQEEINSEIEIEAQPEAEDSQLFSPVKDEALHQEEMVQSEPEEFDSEVPEEKLVTKFDSEERETFTEERKEEDDISVMPSNDMIVDDEIVEDVETKEEVIDSEEKEAIVPQETEIKLEREQEYEKVESQIPSIEISQEPEEVTEMVNEANEEQVNEEIEMMEEAKMEDKNVAPTTETFDSDEVNETIEKVEAIDETIDEIITTNEPAVEEYEVSDVYVELAEKSEQNIENVETKIEAVIEPQVAEEEMIAPVESAAKARADAEKSEASSGPIAANGPADDASIETAEDNDPVMSDKMTNDDTMDNKPLVEPQQSVPPQEISQEDETKSVEVEVKAPVTEVPEVPEVPEVTKADVATAAVVGAVGAVGAVAAVRKSPKPPSTLALTKTTTSKPAGKPREPISTKAPAKPRPGSSKPAVGASTSTVTSRSSSRPGSGVAGRTARPATAPQRPQRPTTTTTTTRPSSASTGARPGAATTRTTRSVQPEAKPAGKTTPPARASGTAGLRMKLTPRPTSTSRLREASAARVKAATPTAPKPQPSARTPLSQRVTSASSQRTKTPTKPSSASASAKELPNTPFARARQARLAAQERQKTPMNGQQAPQA